MSLKTMDETIEAEIIEEYSEQETKIGVALGTILSIGLWILAFSLTSLTFISVIIVLFLCLITPIIMYLSVAKLAKWVNLFLIKCRLKRDPGPVYPF